VVKVTADRQGPRGRNQMHSQLDASKAVCRVCGDVRVLDTDSRLASSDLADFTAHHSIHEQFRIDVVTGPVSDKVWRLPLQRVRSGIDEAARSA
jgi:hypothetical protein